MSKDTNEELILDQFAGEQYIKVHIVVEVNDKEVFTGNYSSIDTLIENSHKVDKAIERELLELWHDQPVMENTEVNYEL